MKNKKGFTLVELLVVIAIIGVLASVAIVNLNSSRTKAKRSALQKYMQNIFSAVNYCIYDKGEFKRSTIADNDDCSDGPYPDWVEVTQGTEMCDGVDWPDLPGAGSIYCSINNATKIAWSYGACINSSEGAICVTCTPEGCDLVGEENPGVPENIEVPT